MPLSKITTTRFSILLLIAIVVNVLSFGGYGSFYNYLPSPFHTALVIRPAVKKADTIVFEEINEDNTFESDKVLPLISIKFDLKATNRLFNYQYQTINQLASIVKNANQQAFLLYQYQFSEEDEFSV